MALIDLTEKASKEIDQTVGARLLVTRRVTQSRIKWLRGTEHERNLPCI